LEDYLSEKEQWERVTGWLRENGLWIVGGVALGALGIFGWQWWQSHVDSVSAQASAKYEQMQSDLAKGDRTGALILLADLERDFASTPYVDQARLAVARVYVEDNELDKANTELQAVSQHSKDKQLALVARLRLARVLIAQQKPDDALTALDGVDPGAFEALFHEVRGDAEFAKGNKAAALTEYRTARSKDTGGGGSDTSLLDLKISDLVAVAAPPAPAAIKVPVGPTSGATTPPPAPTPTAQTQGAK
jgi:predicted negative regulator of RcsB-dependent stress response